MTIRGATGEVRWAYLPAVVFGPWRLETSPAGGALTGTIASVDEYRVAQGPLVAVVTVGRQRLTWPIDSLQIAGATLTAQLGPQTKERP